MPLPKRTDFCLAMFLYFLLVSPYMVFGQMESDIRPMPQNAAPDINPPVDSYDTYRSYDWEFDTSVSFLTGDYGGAQNTDTYYWPFSVKRHFDQGNISLTVPLIYQDGAPAVANRAGRPFQSRRGFFGSDNKEGGIGDLLLSGRYYLLDDSTEDFNLNAMGQIKFPTADEDENLGTGEFDETLGLEGRKSLNDAWTLYTDLYYTFIGDPPFADYDNEFAFDAGVGYDLTASTETTLHYAERTALLDGRDNPRDIILGINHMLRSDTKLYGNLGFGVSDGSPDVSITSGISYLY